MLLNKANDQDHVNDLCSKVYLYRYIPSYCSNKNNLIQ